MAWTKPRTLHIDDLDDGQELPDHQLPPIDLVMPIQHGNSVLDAIQEILLQAEYQQPGEVPAADGGQVETDKQRRWRAAWQLMQGQVNNGKSCAQIAGWMAKSHHELAANNPKTVRAIIKAGKAGELD